jgi:FdhE protein
MSATTIQPGVIQPGEIERPLGEIPFLRLPEPGRLYLERAARLRGLAPGHSLHDYLLFAAAICEGQQAALDAFPEVPLPREEQLRLCREHGMPPLSAQSWQRDPVWRSALELIVDRVEPHANPVAHAALARLREMDEVALEDCADMILNGRYQDADLAIAPLVSAALQVYWTHMAAALGVRAFGQRGVSTLCPVCASHPVASVVRIGGSEQGLRYLSCALCDTQWHAVRVKCSNCESTRDISYFMVEGASGAIKAEACDECGSYLKIMYMDRDHRVDPVADDLATLALDLMMADSGMARSGPNLMLMTPPGPDA